MSYCSDQVIFPVVVSHSKRTILSQEFTQVDVELGSYEGGIPRPLLPHGEEWEEGHSRSGTVLQTTTSGYRKRTVGHCVIGKVRKGHQQKVTYVILIERCIHW